MALNALFGQVIRNENFFGGPFRTGFFLFVGENGKPLGNKRGLGGFGGWGF